jgi:hypothetical protein
MVSIDLHRETDLHSLFQVKIVYLEKVSLLDQIQFEIVDGHLQETKSLFVI